MAHVSHSDQRRLPSVSAVLLTPAAQTAVVRFGHAATVAAIQRILHDMRAHAVPSAIDIEAIAHAAVTGLERAMAPRQRRVFNLTGTVLHTNLGRAVLADAAVEAASTAMRYATNLEYEIEDGKRGERDDHVIGLLRMLTGAEDAVVVNNNAAAVHLLLNTFAKRREVIVSRGELVEIGGAFRIPDIMACSGAKLREVGTTNRTHLRDYEAAIGPRTAMLMKVHTSNYVISGFVAHADGREIAALAARNGLPFAEDLGSGTLVDLAGYGLARERTVADALKEGAHLVTFSGDKLLGGPQAGIVVGRSDLINKMRKNPLKRVLRLDKVRLAALEATLALYVNPERLADDLPTIAFFTRTCEALKEIAARIAAALSARLGEGFRVAVIDCMSQIGSGALPCEQIASVGIAIKPGARGTQAVDDLARAFRHLPIPCIGRIHRGQLVLDLRTLDDEAGFLDQLDRLDLAGSRPIAALAR